MYQLGVVGLTMPFPVVVQGEGRGDAPLRHVASPSCAAAGSDSRHNGSRVSSVVVRQKMDSACRCS